MHDYLFAQGRALDAVAVGQQRKDISPRVGPHWLEQERVAGQRDAAAEDHLRRQGFFLVRRDPDAATRRAHPKLVKVEWQPGYPAYRTSIDQPVARLLERLLAEASGAKPVMLPSFGGSLPLYLFDEILHVPVITLPVVNHDNNQHAANENIRLQNLWDGIESYAGLLAGLGPRLEAPPR